MKKVLSILGLILFPIIIMAQSTVQKRHQKVLKNTLKTKELKAQIKNPIYAYGTHKNGINKPFVPFVMGNSEVFLLISNSGYYTVEFNAEMMSNPYGRFRFFDVQNGTQIISIYQNGYLIYKTPIEVVPHARMVLEFTENQGLFLVDILDSDVNNSPIVMSSSEFMNLKRIIKNDYSFDKDKLEIINIQLSYGKFFNTQQIRELVALFSFDDHKLTLLKNVYPNCIDPENYYVLESELSFDSSKRKFRKMLY